MRVLLAAAACVAGRGSEPGIGWGWATALAGAGHEVTVLTRPGGQRSNEHWLRQHPHTRLTFEYVPDDGPILASPRRHARVLAYARWQRRAARLAGRLAAARPFDVAHHVTRGTYLLGSPLWRLDLPFVLGPVGSGQTAPSGSRPLFADAWREEVWRSRAVRLSALNPIVRATVRRAAVVVAANDDTATRLRELPGAGRVEVMCDTGIDPASTYRQAGPATGRMTSTRPRVVWIGSLVPRKGLVLALDAFALTARSVDAELHIVGGGPQAAAVPGWVAARGLDGRVTLHGQLAWDRAQALVAGADAMLFTSLRETFGSQVLEAAALGVPLVALDLHGVATHVPDDVAVKVPFTTPDTSARSLADGLVTLLTNQEVRARMSRAAISFSADHVWSKRAERMTAIYHTALELSGAASDRP